MGRQCCGGQGQGHGKDGELAGRAIKRAPATGQVVNKGCCGGRDLGPMDEDHEGPSCEDVERFGDVTSTCPSCKVELYDDVAVCWKCGHAMTGSGSSTNGIPKWAIAVAALACGSFIYLAIF